MYDCYCYTTNNLIKGHSLYLTAVPYSEDILSVNCPLELINKTSIGDILVFQDIPLFRVLAKIWHNASDNISRLVVLVEILVDFQFNSQVESPTSLTLSIQKNGYSLAVVTLSDKGAKGEREDTSGPLIEKLVQDKLPLRHSKGYILSDESELLRVLLSDLALIQRYDLIITTGGTGVGPRDITPETMSKVLDCELPGFSVSMLVASLSKTPHAAISRAKAGLIGKSLVINLPGSPKAVEETLSVVLPAIKHTIDKAQGDPADCAVK
ncbi:MogA/MoaB family molybdenum cofactor biosynthesis protein [Desulfovibrio litoralis]|uniref:Molybdopterin adenylyltransferase n=1 Tax=Desulfovibrio litoralis DSM 11393 TaxID=1121455 RepID=A0A1M7S5M4_9BACT|nr:MogA/MoaB family molybdenum cofactor biosynthesis protein [Desulfovibrio litoralis]SHN53979.1 molybdenum cofactor synthesis domain-containing protein [Desulfovibrio litoralis DSM 11393]